MEKVPSADFAKKLEDVEKRLMKYGASATEKEAAIQATKIMLVAGNAYRFTDASAEEFENLRSNMHLDGDGWMI